MLLYSYTMGHCLDPKGRAGKWEKVNSVDYLKTFTDYPYWISYIGRTA